MLKVHIVFLLCYLTFKFLNNLAPYYLSDCFSSVSEFHTVATRNAASNTLQQSRCKNYLHKSSLSLNGSRLLMILILLFVASIIVFLLNLNPANKTSSHCCSNIGPSSVTLAQN